MCNDIFGKKYTNEHIHSLVKQTNIDFGGMKPNVTNIIMTHGGLDPWHPMGLGKDDGAIIIPRLAHNKDFRSIDEKDSKDLRAAKERIAELVREWLSEGKPKKFQKVLEFFG